jgi:alkylresorcinol/alkylpyrone synthase
LPRRAGGVTGLSIASRLAEAWPGSVVLVVVIELYTLSFRLDGSTKANIVATALVGDGAATCVLSAACCVSSKAEFPKLK